MAELNQVSVQLTNPKTKETYDAFLKTKEDSVFLADGTTLTDLKNNLWNSLAYQANMLLNHSNKPHLSENDLNGLIASVSYDGDSGELSVTNKAGNKTVVAQSLNKSVNSFIKYIAEADDLINGVYKTGDTLLKLVLASGDEYIVNLSDYVNQYVSVDDGAEQAQFITEDTNLQAQIATYTSLVKLASVDEDSGISNAIATSTDGDVEPGQIKIIMTGISDASRASAKLFWKDATKSGEYKSVDMHSDANTTPAFTCDFPATTEEYIAVYVIISDIVGEHESAVPVYRSTTTYLHMLTITPEPPVEEPGPEVNPEY